MYGRSRFAPRIRARWAVGLMCSLVVTAMAVTSSFGGAAAATAPTPPSPPAVPTASQTIAYVGCSNTWMTVQGYHDVAGDGYIWPTDQLYGGGSVDQWTPGSNYWATFDSLLSAHPVVAVWWHLCMHPGTTLAQAESVLTQLRQRIGASAPVFASAMSTYTSPTECPIADPADSAAIQAQLIAAGLVRQGPVLQQLSPTTTTDGCHPLPANRDIDGRTLEAFFGGTPVTAPPTTQPPVTTPPTTVPSTTTPPTTVSPVPGLPTGPNAPPPPVLPSPGQVIGYVGCSNTWMTVQGYHDVAGTGKIWPLDMQYSGGSINNWTPGSFYWANFDYMFSAHPVTEVWWHLCMHPGTTLAQAESVLTQLRQRIGNDVPVYASAMGTYSAAGECPMADPAGSAAILSQLLAAGLVQAGPVFQQLTPATTLPDGCHPLPSARDIDGQTLRAFFG